jgi:hypothetical protein
VRVVTDSYAHGTAFFKNPATTPPPPSVGGSKPDRPAHAMVSAARVADHPKAIPAVRSHFGVGLNFFGKPSYKRWTFDKDFGNPPERLD